MALALAFVFLYRGIADIDAKALKTKVIKVNEATKEYMLDEIRLVAMLCWEEVEIKLTSKDPVAESDQGVVLASLFLWSVSG
jgi:hypothetical protein